LRRECRQKLNLKTRNYPEIKRIDCLAIQFFCFPYANFAHSLLFMKKHLKPTPPESYAATIDHTLLKSTASKFDIETLCAEALEWGVAGVCVNSSWVPTVSQLLRNSEVLTVSVIGFPLGTCLTAAKVAEAKLCQELGADEIDMVVNLGRFLSSDYGALQDDVSAVVNAVSLPVKVILETGYLTRQQVTEISQLVAEAKPAFLKTSTGFGPRGASLEDIEDMKLGIEKAGLTLEQIKIKAAGGVSNLSDLTSMISAGASRIGTSRTRSILFGNAEAPGTKSY
jgi:deoxyribose-phosphate aldolase